MDKPQGITITVEDLAKYWGCTLKVKDWLPTPKMTGLDLFRGNRPVIHASHDGLNSAHFLGEIKPILKPVSSVQEEDFNNLLQHPETPKEMPGEPAWCFGLRLQAFVIDELRRRGFDLDNLIGRGLAVEAGKECDRV